MTSSKAKKKWMVYAKKADFAGIGQKYGIDPVAARVLRNRGIMTDAEIDLYLNGGMEQLYDERLLPDAEKAAAILSEKIRAGKRIRIVGDYDIDGVCATYILYRGLKRCGAAVDYAIPDRIRDGYGINVQIIDQAIADGIDTILTCDNGIAAIEELRHAKESGLCVVLTDHHDVRRDAAGEELLPPADAIVNAKLADSRYPSAEICGAVTAWKLLRILFAENGVSESEWTALLEFAAIATVGDVMKLTGENRIIVKEGLKRINCGAHNLGLRKLIEKCDLADREISCYHIGFVIGPCINAGGRLESAERALSLFLTETEADAEHAAMRLRILNDERKQMTEAGTAEALAEVEEKYRADKVLVVYLPKLHESLAGIVAGRLREYYCKPSIVITDSENGCKGSGRSIDAYHMFEGLCGVSDLLQKFGGHPLAAGLSLARENVDLLRRRLNAQAKLTEADFIGKIWIDAAMPLSYISAGLIGDLQRLEPFGTGNEKPVFAAKGLAATDLRVMGKNKNVLKFMLREPGGFAMPAVMFGDAEELKAKFSGRETVSVLYYPQINEYNGRRTLQVVVADIC